MEMFLQTEYELDVVDHIRCERDDAVYATHNVFLLEEEAVQAWD